MAERNRAGSAGWNACLFFFNQPSGVVITTSSNSKLLPSSVNTVTFSGFVSTRVTFVKYLISAFSRAGLAT